MAKYCSKGKYPLGGSNNTYTPTTGPTLTVTPTFTVTRTSTITPTYTNTPYVYSKIIYDGDTSGSRLANFTTSVGGSGTMSETTGGYPNNGLSLCYVSPAYWQAHQITFPTPVAIGDHTNLVFDIKASSSTVAAFIVVANWSVGNVTVDPTYVSGGVIDTTWRTVTIPLSVLLGTNTSFAFLDFVSGANFDYCVMIDNIRLTGGTAPTASPTLQPSTATYTMTNTPQSTSTSTWTATASATATNTSMIPSSTDTGTRTATPSFTATGTPTLTKTAVSSTETFTATRTSMPVNTSTLTPTATGTGTPRPSGSPTNIVPTATFTATMTFTSIAPSNTFTNTPAAPDATFTPSDTSTMTPTEITHNATFTYTRTSTVTATGTQTPLPTQTYTEVPIGSSPTNTPVPPTVTFTWTVSPADTATVVVTATYTTTATSTKTSTATATATGTNTEMPAGVLTDTQTPTPTLTVITPYHEEGRDFVFVQQPLAYANPYYLSGNNDMWIDFALSQTTKSVTVKVYTVQNRLIRRIVAEGNLTPGKTRVKIEARQFEGLARGSYRYCVFAKSASGQEIKSKIATFLIQ
ncbi:MAG: hypothetical protein LLG37_08465 [Spirochaetia bacterium]|nr:hypothetical protein [Spirochaetia bacterium]